MSRRASQTVGWWCDRRAIFSPAPAGERKNIRWVATRRVRLSLASGAFRRDHLGVSASARGNQTRPARRHADRRRRGRSNGGASRQVRRDDAVARGAVRHDRAPARRGRRAAPSASRHADGRRGTRGREDDPLPRRAVRLGVLAERRGRRRLRRVRGEVSSREAPREDAGACFRPTHPRSFPTASLALVPSETRSSPPPRSAALKIRRRRVFPVPRSTRASRSNLTHGTLPRSLTRLERAGGRGRPPPRAAPAPRGGL